jgi:hypothetical protein
MLQQKTCHPQVSLPRRKQRCSQLKSAPCWALWGAPGAESLSGFSDHALLDLSSRSVGYPGRETGKSSVVPMELRSNGWAGSERPRKPKVFRGGSGHTGLGRVAGVGWFLSHKPKSWEIWKQGWGSETSENPGRLPGGGRVRTLPGAPSFPATPRLDAVKTHLWSFYPTCSSFHPRAGVTDRETGSKVLINLSSVVAWKPKPVLPPQYGPSPQGYRTRPLPHGPGSLQGPNSSQHSTLFALLPGKCPKILWSLVSFSEK